MQKKNNTIKSSSIETYNDNGEQQSTIEKDEIPIKKKNVESFIQLYKTQKNIINEMDTDRTIRHFILMGIFSWEMIRKSYKYLDTAINKDKSVLEGKTELEIDKIKLKLSKIPLNQLKDSLKGLELINQFTKEQLIEIISINKEALETIEYNDKKEKLLKLTNIQLREKLKGVPQIYKLKKLDMVEMILSLQC